MKKILITIFILALNMSLSGFIPANGLVRIRPSTTNSSAAYITGQELIF